MFRRADKSARFGASADLLAVGLGNPGSEYAKTRHNVGADVIDLLADRHRASLKIEKGMSARAGQVSVGGHSLALAVPTTYMNDSGVAIAPLVRRYVDGDLTHLVIVHDELDLPAGAVRVKVGGGTAGHNGLKSADSHLHGLGFVRVRIGIGKAPGQMPGREHVLRRPRGEEKEAVDVALERAADAVEMILSEGPERAMSMFNQK